jgi:hypothetical protein
LKDKLIDCGMMKEKQNKLSFPFIRGPLFFILALVAASVSALICASL